MQVLDLAHGLHKTFAHTVDILELRHTGEIGRNGYRRFRPDTPLLIVGK